MISIANDFVIAAKPDKGIGWFEWRAQLLTCALWCALVCGGAAFWGSLLTNPEHIHLNAVLALAAYHLWLLAVAVVGKYPYWLRAASLLLALLAAGCVLIYFSTQLVVGISFIFSFITLSILLLGLQGGAVAAILCIGCLAAATYLLPARGYIFFTQSEPATIVNAFVVGGLSLFAAATAIIPLQLYRMGSSSAFQHGKEQLLEAEQHRIQYQQSLGLITREYDAHLLSEKTLAETIVLLVTARSQDKLLTNALNLIVNNFGFQRAEIFYQADNLKLIHAVHFIDGEGFANQQYDVLDIDQTPIMVQQIVTAEQPQQIMIDWTSTAGADIEAGNVATVWMPISTGRHTAGVLKISKHQGKAFLETEVNALKTNAQLLALGLLNIQISMDGQLQPGNISSANQAIQLLNKAETRDQILKIVQNTFMISTFPSIMFSTDRDVFRLVSVNDPVDSADMEWNPANFSRESFEKLAESNPYFPFQLNDQIDLPEELMNLLLQLGWDCAAFIPIYQNGHLNTLYVLGSRQLPELTPLSIQPYANLAGYATSTLEKVIATRHLQRRVAALQSLAAISQSISVVTELEDLFDTVHEQVTQVMGEIDLAIALYDPGTDMISIPYAHEMGEKISLEPFPLGQGLTSLLLRSHQPLMIVEDTERKARELGAKIVGAPAKSWLGVPLIVSSKILGAIILQDTKNERRFDDDDLRLMTTLASQVAITIRNIRLLQEAKHHAEKERIISSITTKIWSAPDVESITRTALLELGRALRANSGKIRLDMSIKGHRSGEIADEESMDIPHP